MVDLTDVQKELLGVLRAAVEGKPDRRVLYCSEWLGYLPYGVYHWIEVDGQDISSTLPADWRRADLEALRTAGHLAIVEEMHNPADEYEVKIIYEVAREQTGASH
jgi:hypothetical protein